MKRTLAITLTLALLCAVLLCGCGGGTKTLNGTYTVSYNAEQLNGNTFHNGFVSTMNVGETNTITFSEDGSYVYTKDLQTLAEDGTVIDPDGEGNVAIAIRYTYYGTYTMDGSNAVLAWPTKCEFQENWGMLAQMGMFRNSSGTYTWENGAGSGDLVQCKEEESHNPMDIFVSPYVLDSVTTSEAGFSAEKYAVTVTPNTSDKTFTYVIVNTDDD